MRCNNSQCKREAKTGKKLCENCSDSLKQSKRRQNETLKAAGLCVDCRQQSNGNLRCSECSLRNSLRRLFGSIVKFDELKSKLSQQNARCAYTGLSLVIGENASVDHIQPKSKGGTDELQNLHWVHSGVNRLKGSMSHEEFILFLRELRHSLNSVTL